MAGVRCRRRKPLNEASFEASAWSFDDMAACVYGYGIVGVKGKESLSGELSGFIKLC